MTCLLIGFSATLNSSTNSFIGDQFFTDKDFSFYLHKVEKVGSHDGTPACHGNGQEIFIYTKKATKSRGIIFLFSILLILS